MEYRIKTLQLEDRPYLEQMDSGIEDDYVKRIFERLVTTDANRLFGLFLGEQLVSVCGYSIFAKHYAMIGRIRSDIRFRGKDFATKLTAHVLNAAFQLPDIQWVGANTQEENIPARRVLQKLNLAEHRPLYGATTDEITLFDKGGQLWQEIQQTDRKKEWLQKLYVKPGAVFPYECYYLFPASDALFTDDTIAKWQFFENASGDRVLILKTDFKKHNYLHAIYPWSDLMEQPGLWETISAGYRKYATASESDAFIWMDLTKEQAASLPEGHKFKLPSAWVLHGTSRKSYADLKNSALSTSTTES